ncbi:type II secretion system protein GspD [Roseiterribacter gracilis]|uniref:type II secretion system protein GspD n=1 Tax=Roseiterribacter gracilis TaxID=2812848 RepID=UPI003B42A888
MRRLLLPLFLLGLVSCSEQPKPFLATTLPPKVASQMTTSITSTTTTDGLRVTPGPSAEAVLATGATRSTPSLTGAPVSASLDQVPIPRFIDAVFGDTLKVAYEVDQRVASRTELVTLRTPGSASPQKLVELASQVLSAYGVAVVKEGALYRIAPSDALAARSPQVLRSRALAEVPVGLRPLFQVVDLHAVRSDAIANALTQAYGQKVRATPLPDANAVLLLGLADDVRDAVEATRILDQPKLAGARSVKLQPAYWSAEKFATRLVEVLRAQGYAADTQVRANTAITILPIETGNTVIAFAADQKTLEQVVKWARTLDVPNAAGQGKTLFYYAVRNTSADGLAQVLNQLLEGLIGADRSRDVTSAAASGDTMAMSAAPAMQQQPMQQQGAMGIGGQSAFGNNNVGATGIAGQALPTQPSMVGVNPNAAGSGGDGRRRLVVDPTRNALIFRGTSEEWGQILPLLRNMDQAGREALIEVTVAEVTLDETTRLGVEWALSVGLGGAPSTIGTLGGLGIGQNGLNYVVLNSAREVRAILNAFANDSRVSILSSPRVLARNGAEARIQVGTDVPIVTSQGTTNIQQDANTAILQSIQYRTTGVILNVKPTIHAGNRIDLDIAQEVSEAQKNDTSNVSSPLILNRRVSTQLSLADGATVMLGGLISENLNRTKTGVPVLKDIPVLGTLFKNDVDSRRKTELIILITPYVINNDSESDAVTRAFRQRLETLQIEDPPRLLK